jgi:hypothetical protein
MRTLLISACLLATILPAQAISRYNSMQLSCDQAQSRIASEGAVILRYRSARDPSLPLFDRYVAHDGWCDHDQYARLFSVPTADATQCPVLKCFPRVRPFHHDD